MISRIQIRNFAIIEELDLEIKPGLTVITGETGSGKSIILQALAVSLGMKPTKTMVRTGQPRAVVETTCRHLDTSIDISRVIPAKGRVKNYIDDGPVIEADFRLKTISMADFHGQHEQQLIMDSATHIDYLDNYSGNKALSGQLNDVYDSIDATRQRLKADIQKKQRALEKRELLDFQLKEITAIGPKIGEDIELLNEFKIGSNREELLKSIENLITTLSYDEKSVMEKLSVVAHELERLVKFDSNLSDYITMVNESIINIQEVNDGLAEHTRSLDIDQERLTEVEERLQSLESLKRKYGGSLDSVLDFKSSIEVELSSIESLGDGIAGLEKELSAFQIKYQELADKIHKRRVSASGKLSKAIEQEMKKLQMPGARFDIRLTTNEDEKSPFTCDGKNVRNYPSGYDVVSFFLSANPGEIPKPLTEIASGGEVSRIMLAIKTVLQSNDPVNTLIFDEIDSGISGAAAETVADSLVKLSRGKQVICITHLPQIAVRADQHLRVTKEISSNKTSVSADYLTEESIFNAIARLSSGVDTTDDDLQAAKSLYERYHG